MDYESLAQFFWIKILWVFATWLKVEPSKHDSELKEMSELFILGTSHVCTGENPGFVSVDMKSSFQLSSSVTGAIGFTRWSLGDRGGRSDISKREFPLTIVYFCSVWLAFHILGYYGAWHIASWGSYCLNNWETSKHYLSLGPVRIAWLMHGWGSNLDLNPWKLLIRTVWEVAVFSCFPSSTMA